MDRRRRAPWARTRSRRRAGWREGRPPAAVHDRASQELRRARGRPHVRGDRRDGAPTGRTLAPSVPTAAIAQVSERIQTGDVLAFATSIPGLDVTHTAMAYRDGKGVLRVLHAPLSGGTVEESRRML